MARPSRLYSAQGEKLAAELRELPFRVRLDGDPSRLALLVIRVYLQI